MVQYFDITENALKQKAFEAEAIYFCVDSGNVYLDSIAEKQRIKMASEIIFLATETSKDDILAPLPNKIYCVLESGKMYINPAGTWIPVGGTSQIEFNNVFVEDKTLSVTDVRIKPINTGEFIPDSSVADLVTSISVVCADGSATITLVSDYPIPGRLIIR